MFKLLNIEVLTNETFQCLRHKKHIFCFQILDENDIREIDRQNGNKNSLTTNETITKLYDSDT